MTTEGLPEFLLSDLPTADRRDELKTVRQDSLVTEAKRIMGEHDFSQLPVLTDDGRIHGVVSWRSLACKEASTGTTAVEACEPIPDGNPFSLDTPVVNVLDIVFEHEFILTCDGDSNLCGIVTAADMARWAKHSLKAFLAVARIEHHLRKELDNAPTPLGSDPVDSDSWTFGDYLKRLRDPVTWEWLSEHGMWSDVHRCDFLERLDEARKARNETFHFRRTGVEANTADERAVVRERNAKILADFAECIGRITARDELSR